MEICGEERGRSSIVQNVALPDIKTLPAQCPSAQIQPKNTIKYMLIITARVMAWEGKEEEEEGVHFPKLGHINLWLCCQGYLHDFPWFGVSQQQFWGC